MKINKTKITIAVLVLLLVIALSYIAIEKYQEAKQKEQLSVFKEGVQYGYEQAILQVASIAVECEQVPLQIQNQTINVVAVDCLQK